MNYLANEKLRLQVDELRSRSESRKTGADKSQTYEKLIPLLSTLLAILAFLFSVVQFTTTQKADREKATLTQIQNDLKSLLKEAQGKEPRAAVIVASLDDLYARTDGNQPKRKEIADIFVQLFTFDFIDTEHVTSAKIRYESLVNDYWPEYRNSLEDDPELNARLTRRYMREIKNEKIGTLMYDSLQGALYRHGKRFIDSQNDSTASKVCDQVKADEQLVEMNKYMNHYKFSHGQLEKTD